MITWDAQWTTVPPRDAGPPPKVWSPNSLHGDTNTDEMFLFTTILYLSQHGDDVRGGETGIADVVEDDPSGFTTVTAGLRVQPSIGRLLVFSSGVENMHEMLVATHGKRIAVQMWFACEGMQPGWAEPQRVQWQSLHGWGGPDGQLGGHAKAPKRSSKPPPRPWPWR